jgi:ribosomal-protein-alanine N-acetyltransferase
MTSLNDALLLRIAEALERMAPPPADRLSLDGAALGGFWSDSQWRSELEGSGRLCLGIDAADPGAPASLVAVACGWLVVDELHITLVAVDPHWRRQGLGRRVLDQLLATGHRRGAGRATLEVACGNAPARGLYGSLGFTEAGVRRGYYRNGDDALIQWTKLSDRTGFG